MDCAGCGPRCGSRQTLRCGRNGPNGASAGSVVIESVIFLPVLLLLVSGLAVLGSFFLQFHLMNDVAHEAARTASHRSTSLRACTSLEAVASAEVVRLRSQLPLIPSDSTAWADAPSVGITQDSWDGFPFQSMNVAVASQSSGGFSLMGLRPPENIRARASFMLVQPCAL